MKEAREKTVISPALSPLRTWRLTMGRGMYGSDAMRKGLLKALGGLGGFIFGI